MRVFLFMIGFIAWILCDVLESKVLAQDTLQFADSVPSIHVNVDASTWKTRGRLLYDVEGSILKKLALTGFEVVRNRAEPHQFTLSVSYREDQGEQYAVNAYGTVINCVFRLKHNESDNLLEIGISETSHNAVSGTAPYLDALQKFQTNPYYFFLGEILQGRVQKNLELKEALIFALERQIAEQKEKGNLNDSSTSDQYMNPAFSMEPPRELYGPIAVRRAIDELVDAMDHRAVQVLLVLVDHSDTAVRVRAIEALGVFRVTESRSHLSGLAKNDRDPQVRKAAESVAKLLTTTPPAESP